MMNFVFDLVGALAARVNNERGQTMAEYGILIAVIAVIVVLAATLLGSNVSSLFSSTGGHL
jgi:pilus assembly protein Flp/PilA